MNNSKCNKCGLVNPAGDLACRRCGGLLRLPVRKSPSAAKATYPRYLFMLPFLLLALGFGYWSGKIKQSVVDAINVDKAEWHALTPASKVNRKDPPLVLKPGDPLEGLKQQQDEDQKRKSKPWSPIKAPERNQSQYKKP